MSARRLHGVYVVRTRRQAATRTEPTRLQDQTDRWQRLCAARLRTLERQAAYASHLLIETPPRDPLRAGALARLRLLEAAATSLRISYEAAVVTVNAARRRGDALDRLLDKG